MNNKLQQTGQTLLIALAALAVLAAAATVAYTIFNRPSEPEPVVTTETPPAPEPVATPVEPVKTTPLHLQKLAGSLIEKHLKTGNQSRLEDFTALKNTLSNLAANPSEQAQTALKALEASDIDAALEAMQNLALDTKQDDRTHAKYWVDIGNVQNLVASDKAIGAYEKSVALDKNNINAWNRIGHMERRRKNFDKAEVAYGNVSRLAGDASQTKALALTNYGLLNQSKGKFDDAVTAFSEALEINKTLENSAGIASNSENLAGLYLKSKRWDEAEVAYQQALDIHKASDQIAKQLQIHSALGSLYQRRQQSELALQQYESALTLNDKRETPNVLLSAGLHSNIGILAQQNNDMEKASTFFNKSLALYQQSDHQRGIADQFSNLAILERNQKRFDESEKLHLQALEIYKATDHSGGVITQQINMGFLYTAWGKKEQACSHWQDSLESMKALKSPRKARIEAIVAKECTAKPEAAEEKPAEPQEPEIKAGDNSQTPAPEETTVSDEAESDANAEKKEADNKPASETNESN